ncbi:MAG: ankyrin repeat domain-containing protein [Nocardioides sp.]
METPAEMLERQVRWAADHGFTERLELLAAHGVDVSGVQVHDRHALPADLNAKTDGHTPLHQAAWDGDLDLIRRLLDAGADPSLVDDEFGSRPLEWAEYAYQQEAADLLRAHTSDLPPA